MRQGPWLAAELQVHLVQVVLIDVRVAEGVHEVAWLETAHLRHHHREQRIAGNVERHSEEYVGRALVELAREFAVGDIELEQAVARRQRHVLNFGGIPCRHQQATAVRVLLNLAHHIGNLVDGAAVPVGPRTPLAPVHGT